MVRWLQRWIKRLQEKRQAKREWEERTRELRFANMDRMIEEFDVINGLSIEEAKQRFFEGVATGRFELTYEPLENIEILMALPPLTRELFEKVSYVYVNKIAWAIDRNSFDAKLFPGFVVLGGGHEITLILIKTDSDEVYEMESGTEIEEMLEDGSDNPTIYHLLLCRAVDTGES